MKPKAIDVSYVIKSITDLGGQVMSIFENVTEFENLTPEMVKNLNVLVPLYSETDKDEEKQSKLICVEKINVNKTYRNWLYYSGQRVLLNPELVKNLLLLKLYSDSFKIIAPKDE